MIKRKIFKLFRLKKKEKNSTSPTVALSRDGGDASSGQIPATDGGQASAPGTAELASTAPPPFPAVANTPPETNDRPPAPTASTSVVANRVDAQTSPSPVVPSGPPSGAPGGQTSVADERQASALGTTAEIASADPPPPFSPVDDTSPETNDRPPAPTTSKASVLADRVDEQKSASPAVPGLEGREGNFAELLLPPTLPDDSDFLPVPTSPPVLRRSEELLSIPLQGILEGAKDFKIENSVLTNVQGNVMIFKLDGDGPLNEEFKLWFADYVAGSVTVEERDKLQKHVLSQAVRNLPRTNAAYNDYTSKDRRRTTCFQGTRQRLLKEMAMWAGDPNSPPVYVLSGPAGMGKSTIAQTIAAKTDVLRQLGASFFFSREGSDRRNAEKFFTTIAFQLCNHDKEFSQAIGDALLADHGAAAPTKEPLEQLRALILEPLLPLIRQRSRPVFVIVDALDECEEEDGQIVLKGLDQLVRKLRSFKVILTARPQPHLQYLFTNLATKIFYLQNIEDKIVDGDIRIYLKHNLSEEEVKSRLPYMKPWNASDQEIDALVQGAGGLFIIASTTILFILDTIARDPESRLQKLLNSFAQDRLPLTTLNNFYMTIVRSAVPEDCDPDIIERYKAVIGAIVTAKEPLPIDALAELIGLSPKDIHAVLFNLQSVIVVGDNDNIPRVYHKSFPDYVTDPKRCKDSNMLIILRERHTQIAIGCLQIMNTSLKRNILGLDGPAQFLEIDDVDDALQDESVKDRVRENIKPILIYACAHWASHVLGADTMERDLLGALQKFAYEHLLHWVEALSWTEHLGLAYNALAPLLPLLRSTSPNIYDILSDGLRFVWKFFETIEESPLHTYHSALLFTPTKSHLYLRNRNELLQNLCQLEGGPEDWDPLITTLSHNSLELGGRIVFSQASSQFASLADDELVLWDATSGMHLRTFDANLPALSDDFSVAVLSRGRKVEAYKVKNEAPFATQSHPRKVVALALSFDGSRIAAALSDGTVNLWDLTKDKAIAILSGYALENTGFETDEDSTSEANTDWDDDDNDDESALDDNLDLEEDPEESSEEDSEEEAGEDDDGHNTNVVDLSDEDTNHDDSEEDDDEDDDENEDEDNDDSEYEGSNGGDNVFRLAFSPTGDRLAFVSTDGVRLWNNANGEHINSMDHESEDVLGLTFAPDRTGLLSLAHKDGSYNLRVWDAKGGNFVGTIEDVGRPLAISADRPLLAAARNKTVRLWSRESLTFVRDFDVGKTTKSLAFSRNMLAVGLADNSVTVYDIQGNTPPVSLQINLPLTLAFSHDGTRLAAGNDDNEIRLWDVPSLKTYIPPATELELTEVTALAISPDCSRVASGFKDGTVQLWGTGRERHVISSHKIHSGKVSALSFDHEGERFASGSGDKTVRFWNGKNGSLISKLDHTFASRLTSLSFSRSLLAAATKASITLWECESSRLVGTLEPGGNSLAFSLDGRILTSVHGEDEVTVWEVEKQESFKKFYFPDEAHTLVFSPNSSRILCWPEFEDIRLFDTTNNKFIADITSEDFALIPHLNGIPITWGEDPDYGYCLVGRFSVDHAWVPVLLMPRDSEISAFASRSSMFVVGCKDGRHGLTPPRPQNGNNVNVHQISSAGTIPM